MELLVVIAIIAIVAALALPVMRNARAKSLETKCLSNLRQLSAANILYRNEKGKMVPAYDINAGPGVPTQTWVVSLMEYLPGKLKDEVDPSSVFNCPARKPLTGMANWWNEGKSYGLNPYLSDPQWDFRFAVIPKPAQIIWLAEMVERNTEWVKTADNLPAKGSPMSFRHSKDPDDPADRQDRTNVAFCDGHVASVTREKLVLTPTNAESHWRWW